MAEIQFKILRGLSNTLQTAAPKELGTWYLTTDTNELFVGSGTPDNVSIEPVNQQVVFVTSRSALPLTGRRGIVYIIEQENLIYRYDETQNKFVLLSGGTNYNDIEVINCGDADDWE